MSHNIHENRDGTFAAIFSGVIESIWHRLGKAVGNRGITLSEAESVLSIPLITSPLYRDTKDGPVESSHRSIVRTDENVELAVVGPDYELVDYDIALVDPVKPFVQEGMATIDTAFLLGQGEKGVLLLKWNREKFPEEVQRVFEESGRVYPFGACIANQGYGSNQYLQTTIRMVCANTVRIGLERGNRSDIFRVHHRAKAATRTLDAVKEAFGSVVAANSQIAMQIDALKRLRLRTEAFVELVLDKAAPLPEEGARSDVIERAEARRDRVTHLWFNGDGHTGDASAWEAVNGLIQSLDHDVALWRGKNAESRFNALVGGNLAEIRRSVWDGLAATALGVPESALASIGSEWGTSSR